jgi:hypothetical protein
MIAVPEVSNGRGCMVSRQAEAIYFASRIEHGIYRRHTSSTADEDGPAAACHGMENRQARASGAHRWP